MKIFIFFSQAKNLAQSFDIKKSIREVFSRQSILFGKRTLMSGESLSYLHPFLITSHQNQLPSSAAEKMETEGSGPC